jgi:hypothetical protein
VDWSCQPAGAPWSQAARGELGDEDVDECDLDRAPRGAASANAQPRLAAAREIGRRPAIASQELPVRLLIVLPASPVSLSGSLPPTCSNDGLRQRVCIEGN